MKTPANRYGLRNRADQGGPAAQRLAKVPASPPADAAPGARRDHQIRSTLSSITRSRGGPTETSDACPMALGMTNNGAPATCQPASAGCCNSSAGCPGTTGCAPRTEQPHRPPPHASECPPGQQSQPASWPEQQQAETCSAGSNEQQAEVSPFTIPAQQQASAGEAHANIGASSQTAARASQDVAGIDTIEIKPRRNSSEVGPARQGQLRLRPHLETLTELPLPPRERVGVRV